MTTLKEAKKKFKGEWLAFLVKEEAPEVSGEVLEHNKDRNVIHKKLRQKRVKYAYITYAG
ncbi:MAG: hypothetical protein HY769_08490, partial [Candidatus Stahlbacteria bacterium]|nr:hypothetical protein [Candidatus Stahlbacteria bacterium]